MKKIIVFLGLLLPMMNVNIWANNGVVYVTKIENKKKIVVPMVLEIDGDIKMYSMQTSETEIVQINEAVIREVIIENQKEYYLGHGLEAEIVTVGNFKKVAKRYFSDTPDLVKRIGKRGFRYENLPSMVLYHNKLKSKGRPLTKMDIKHWTLLN